MNQNNLEFFACTGESWVRDVLASSRNGLIVDALGIPIRSERKSRFVTLTEDDRYENWDLIIIIDTKKNDVIIIILHVVIAMQLLRTW